MPRQQTHSRAELRRRARLLRSFGYKVRLDPRTGAHKTAITKGWNKVRRYVEPGKQGERHKFKFQFVPTDTKQKRKVAEGIHPTMHTPGGVFVRVPTNVKSYRVKWEKNALRVDAVGMRGGKRTERVAQLDAAGLVKDAPKEIRRVTNKLKGRGKWKAAKLVVNGYDAATIKSAKGEPGGWDSPEGWFNYMDSFFATAVTGDEEMRNFHGKPGSLTESQFAEIFHVKVITQTASTQKAKVKRGRKTIRRSRR